MRDRREILLRQTLLALSAALVVGSWGLCAFQYATKGGGGYGGDWASLILVAAVLSISAPALLVRAWSGRGSVIAAVPVSILAAASILLLAVAIGARG
jgi:hypothetical protein